MRVFHVLEGLLKLEREMVLKGSTQARYSCGGRCPGAQACQPGVGACRSSCTGIGAPAHGYELVVLQLSAAVRVETVELGGEDPPTIAARSLPRGRA